MGQKKNSKIILIIIILLIILILLVGSAFLYFSTDLFKSNKSLFFKYITQIGDEKEGIIDDRLTQYFEKQKNVPHTNEGNLTFNMNSENRSSAEYDSINNFNISFSGKTDSTKNSAEQNINLNYSDEVTFPINYRKVQDKIGLQTKYVGNKYITVDTQKLENENYEELSGIDQVIKQKENIEQLPWNQEEVNKTLQTYINVIDTQLQDSQFSKIEENNEKGYKLTINNEQVKNILIQLLETLKNDQPTIDQINEYLEQQENSQKITTNTIDNKIKELERSEFEDENYEVTIFEQKGKITKLILETQELKIQLEKKEEENALYYKISFEGKNNEEDFGISLSANYAGLNLMEEVNESYQIEIIGKGLKYQYQYNNNNKFTDPVSIEEFSDENALILTDYEEEQVNNFLEQVRERIILVNQQQMEELGLSEEQNPIIQMFNLMSQDLISNSTNNNNLSEMEELEVNTFNQKFENYESTNLKGVTVKGLLSTIQLNNESQEEDRKIKEIHFDGEEYEVNDQNIVFIKNSIEPETAYRVEFERDENTGIIYRAVINKK